MPVLLIYAAEEVSYDRADMEQQERSFTGCSDVTTVIREDGGHLFEQTALLLRATLSEWLAE